MSSNTVGSLAREIGVAPQQLIVHLKALGAKVSSASHEVDPKLAEAIRAIPDMIKGARRPFQRRGEPTARSINIFGKQSSRTSPGRAKKYKKVVSRPKRESVSNFAQGIDLVEHIVVSPPAPLMSHSPQLQQHMVDEASLVTIITMRADIVAAEEIKAIVDRRMHSYLEMLKKHDKRLAKLENAVTHISSDREQ